MREKEPVTQGPKRLQQVKDSLGQRTVGGFWGTIHAQCSAPALCCNYLLLTPDFIQVSYTQSLDWWHLGNEREVVCSRLSRRGWRCEL